MQSESMYMDINLKYTRQRLGIQQQDFADEIGVLRTTLSRIENENKVLPKHFVKIHHCYPEYFPYPEDFEKFRSEYIYQYIKEYGEYPADIVLPEDYFDYSGENLVLNIHLCKYMNADEVARALGYKNQFGLMAAVKKDRNFYDFKDKLNEIFKPYFIVMKNNVNDSNNLRKVSLISFRMQHGISRRELARKTGISLYLIEKMEKTNIISADYYKKLSDVYPKDFPLPEDFNVYNIRNFYYNLNCGFSNLSKLEIAKKFGCITIAAMNAKYKNVENLYDDKEIINSVFNPYLIAMCRKDNMLINAIDQVTI